MKRNKEKSINSKRMEDTRIISEITRTDIEKSYNLQKMNGTEAYYSNRYGWTLRRIEK